MCHERFRLDVTWSWTCAFLIMAASGCAAWGQGAAVYVVDGAVVDAQGNRLTGVKMKMRAALSSLPPHDQYETAIVQTDAHGGFSISARGPISLLLLKQGFHPEHFEFSSGDVPHVPPPVVSGEPIPRRFEWNDLRIVLTKLGAKTELDHRAARLTLEAGGSGSVFTYDRADREGPLNHRARDVGTRAVPDARLTHPLATPGIKVSVPEQNGRLVSKAVEVTTGQSPYSMRIPFPLKLEAFGVNAGFIRYDEGQRLEGKTMRGRHLLEAPAVGYAPSLDLDPQEIVRANSGSGPYFYVRLGDKYGRGKVRRIDWSQDLTSVTVQLELQMQPDGSRNLETGERF